MNFLEALSHAERYLRQIPQIRNAKILLPRGKFSEPLRLKATISRNRVKIENNAPDADKNSLPSQWTDVYLSTQWIVKFYDGNGGSINV